MLLLFFLLLFSNGNQFDLAGPASNFWFYVPYIQRFPSFPDYNQPFPPSFQRYPSIMFLIRLSNTYLIQYTLDNIDVSNEAYTNNLTNDSIHRHFYHLNTNYCNPYYWVDLGSIIKETITDEILGIHT